MIPVRTVGEVFDAIQQAKTGAPAYCTNFFPVQAKLEGWIDHGELWSEIGEAAALLFRKDRDFWHLYFCAASVAALRQEVEASASLKAERVVIDLVGNELALGDLLALMESAKFRRYTHLSRMARAGHTDPQDWQMDGSPVVRADKPDCEAVLGLLDQVFDRYGEQLPMRYEIETAVESRQILAVKRDKALAALLFFETHGLTSTLRFWAVSEQFRSCRFGSALMRHYFATQKAVRRFILWVTTDNENAIQKYRHFGYAPDGLVDHVLANELIRP